MAKLPRDAFGALPLPAAPALGKGDRIRPLHAPRPCHVERGRYSLDGRHWLEIAAIVDEWIVCEGWHRPEYEEDRKYRKLRLSDGQIITVYEDRIRGGWFRQDYSSPTS